MFLFDTRFKCFVNGYAQLRVIKYIHSVESVHFYFYCFHCPDNIYICIYTWDFEDDRVAIFFRIEEKTRNEKENYTENFSPRKDEYCYTYYSIRPVFSFSFIKRQALFRARKNVSLIRWLLYSLSLSLYLFWKNNKLS